MCTFSNPAGDMKTLCLARMLGILTFEHGMVLQNDNSQLSVRCPYYFTRNLIVFDAGLAVLDVQSAWRVCARQCPCRLLSALRPSAPRSTILALRAASD